MNKTLIALACLASCATSTFAQSSTQAPAEQPLLTVYGRVDMSVQSVSRGDATADANKTITGKTSGAIDTSIIGLRVKKLLDSGDYIGGNVESSVLNSTSTTGITETGTMTNRVFDRGAYVSYGNDKWGRVDLGYAPNPMINVSTVPMGGNSVNVATAYSMNWAEYYTTQSITYSTPNLSGFRGQIQYGAADDITSKKTSTTVATKVTSGGPLVAGIADYSTPVFGLSFAMQHRQAGNGAGTAANPNALEKTTYLAAARYTLGDLKLGASLWHNSVKGYDPVAPSSYSVNAWQLGFAYKLAQDWTAGASYSKNSVDSNMTNAQLHYALNKATTLYAQVSHVNNSNPVGRSSGAYGNFYTVNAPNIAGLTPYGVNNGSATATGLGVIHRF